MLLSLQSTNEDYSTIRSNIDIPWECKYIKYWISSVNFDANMLVSTSNDCINLHRVDNNEKATITFGDKVMLTKDDLKGIMKNSLIDFDEDEFGRIVMTPLFDVMIDYITPRARMITGLMDIEVNKVYSELTAYVFDRPISNYANKLYIISKQGNAVHTNVGKQEYTPSILASIDTVIRNRAPVIVNFEAYGKPIKTITNIDSFKYLELQLVDMMLNPVKLLNPMFITLKVKPVKSPHVKVE